MTLLHERFVFVSDKTFSHIQIKYYRSVSTIITDFFAAKGAGGSEMPSKATKRGVSNSTEDVASEKKTKMERDKFLVVSWNVNGIRAVMKRDQHLWFAKNFPPEPKIKTENDDLPIDCICLQETKYSDEGKLPPDLTNLMKEYSWHATGRKGYAGVATFTRFKPLSVQIGLNDKALDDEAGRCIIVEHDQFYIVNTYVRNAGQKLVNLDARTKKWDVQLRAELNRLNKVKPVIWCGDLNVAHYPIDIANPKTNLRNAGFTVEERTSFSQTLANDLSIKNETIKDEKQVWPFVDTFRYLNPDKQGAYTWWSVRTNGRAKNIGWRLDYFIVSRLLMNGHDNNKENGKGADAQTNGGKDSVHVLDSRIHDDILGSDHCPVSLVLKLK